MNFREYAGTTGIAAFYMLARFLYYPVLAPYIKSIGLNDFQIGLILAAFDLVVFLTAPIIGRFSDKIGRKAVMLFGLTASIIGLIFYLIDAHWLTFLLARILMAIGFVSVVIIGIARIEDHIGNKARGKYSGWSLTLIDGAKIIAPPLGGWLADYYFVKLPFLIAIIIICIQFMYLLFAKKRQDRQPISYSDLNLFKLLRDFMANSKLRGMAFLGMVMHAAIPLHLMFIPLLIKIEWGMPYRYVGYALFAFMAGHFLQFALGRFADKIGNAKAVVMGTGLYGITLLFMSQAKSYVVLVILMAVWGVWSSLWNVSAWSFMSDIGERHKTEGAVVCSYISWAKAGSFLSFAVGGLFVMYLGLPAFMVLMGLLILAVTFIAYPLLKNKICISH
ncbi:MAG: MFS transporter [Nanoarchaeota archaeon]|nr:MFS transporter [Nanoarchaeota archaeon]